MSDPNGWETSAAAWIASLGEAGDFSRRYVLDRPVLERVRAARPSRALDVGCGEGRFCRMLKAEGVAAVGVDPSTALIAEARRRDPAGDYRIGFGEALDFEDGAFDLVVSYLSLLDIDDAETAIREMTRVAAPGGHVLIVNQTGFATAAVGGGWSTEADGRRRFEIDDYLETRPLAQNWRGITVRNWHRPLEFYMRAFLEAGLALAHFAEPAPYGGPPDKADRYRRAPLFVVMEWRKP
ncbi:MAG: class I SAM-dependent methyltransferase [Parvularculaceae bacterium]|nr:class I SAM-dependent methyltransferase [Parvularculaceae bacterium]